MTAPDPRVGEIEAVPAVAIEAAAVAVARNDCRSQWEADLMFKHFPSDYRSIARAALEAAHPYLLAELRKAHEAPARVEKVADRLNWEADNANEGAKYAAEVNQGASLMALESERFAYQKAEHLIRAAVAAAKGGEE